MKKIILSILLVCSLSAKEITPNDVYSEVMLITDEIHYLLKYYNINHHHKDIMNRIYMTTKVKPRNVWQMTYEIMVKINILRDEYNLPIIEPVNMPPVLHLNPDLVYEQTQRILAELKIFMIREDIPLPKLTKKSYRGKTPLDVYIGLGHISASFDELNGGRFTPSYVYGEQIRVNNDITMILQHLNIEDKTIPKKKDIHATPEDVFNESMKILEKIKQLQILAGIDFVNFNSFKKGNETPGEVYNITQMIIAELQTIKAYIGISTITMAASKYEEKTSAEVKQLVSWNLRKLNLISSLNVGNK